MTRRIEVYNVLASLSPTQFQKNPGCFWVTWYSRARGHRLSETHVLSIQGTFHCASSSHNTYAAKANWQVAPQNCQKTVYIPVNPLRCATRLQLNFASIIDHLREHIKQKRSEIYSDSNMTSQYTDGGQDGTRGLQDADSYGDYYLISMFTMHYDNTEQGLTTKASLPETGK
jgi:hypothetical protein